MDGTQLINSLLFRPERGFFITPDQLGLAYVDMVFRARDGTGLHGWFVPLGTRDRSGRNPVTILFMHGVAGNISHRVRMWLCCVPTCKSTSFCSTIAGTGGAAVSQRKKARTWMPKLPLKQSAGDRR